MQHDPTIYIIAAGLLCGSLGFMSACIVCARRIRRAETEGWKAGVSFYQDQQSPKPRL